MKVSSADATHGLVRFDSASGVLNPTVKKVTKSSGNLLHSDKT